MRLAIFASLIMLAACQPAPDKAAQDKIAEDKAAAEREAMGQDDPSIPFNPQPPGPPRTYEAMSKTAMGFTPGVLTLTPTAQRSENLPPGANFAFGNGYILETTLNPGGAEQGPAEQHPKWASIFQDLTGAAIDPAKVELYDVDNETIPKDAPNGGFCKKTSFLATYTVKTATDETLTIAAFSGDQWPPAAETALCGTFSYSAVK